MRRRMFQPDGSADDVRLGSAAAVAEGLVTVADDLAVDAQDVGRRHAGCALQPVSRSMRYEGELAGRDRDCPIVVGEQGEGARDGGVKPDVARHGR